jgi:glycerol-3-phosphate acyltransferase PlsY
MFTLFASLASLLLGYLLGAFPTGFFAGKRWNVDVRKHGSGRTGGTNVLRTAGWGAFAITVIGDVLKGAVAVLISRWIFPDVQIGHALAALGALLGHNWSIWIALLAKSDPSAQYAPPPMGWIQRLAQQGRGGAGVATTAAAVMALFPPVVLVLIIPVLLIFLATRYASVGSLSAAILAPFVMLYFCLTGSAPWVYLILLIVGCTIIILVHRPNIERLRAGTEKRFGQRLGQREVKK